MEEPQVHLEGHILCPGIADGLDALVRAADVNVFAIALAEIGMILVEVRGARAFPLAVGQIAASGDGYQVFQKASLVLLRPWPRCSMIGRPRSAMR